MRARRGLRRRAPGRTASTTAFERLARSGRDADRALRGRLADRERRAAVAPVAGAARDEVAEDEVAVLDRAVARAARRPPPSGARRRGLRGRESAHPPRARSRRERAPRARAPSCPAGAAARASAWPASQSAIAARMQLDLVAVLDRAGVREPVADVDPVERPRRAPRAAQPASVATASPSSDRPRARGWHRRRGRTGRAEARVGARPRSRSPRPPPPRRR